MLTLLPLQSTQAALQQVGATDPANGFPTFYRDTNNVPVVPCLDKNGFCVLPPLETFGGVVTFDPALPISFPTNYPSEAFYWIADSDPISVGPTGTGKAILRMALEGAFGTLNPVGAPQAGQQVTFMRVNLKKILGLTPNSTYTVTYPFGNFTFTTDALGNTDVGLAGQAFRTEDGCFGAPCDFSLLLPVPTTHVTNFLTWTGLPAGGLLDPVTGNHYIGDGVTPHTITAGPNGAFFRIDGPNIGGTGINTIQTNLWVLSGKMASLTPVLQSISVTPGAVSLLAAETQTLTATSLDQFLAPIATTVTWTSSNTAAATVSATGVVTAVAPGSATITATSGTVSGSATVVVTTATSVLTTINVTPATATVAIGSTQAFTAATLDQFGGPILAPVTWTSSNVAVGTVDAGGVFRPAGVGSALITTTSGTVSGSATVTVTSTGLTSVGPIDPANGYPAWYGDADGMLSALCLDQTTYCVLPGLETFGGVVTYNPALPISFPTNYPSEAFYWIADSDPMNVGPTAAGKAILRMALEGAFGTLAPVGAPAAGQQMTFMRINFKKTSGLTPNSTFTVTYPFGSFTFTTNALGDTDIALAGQAFRTEDGCVGTPCDFTLVLPVPTAHVNKLLTWTGLPAGGLVDPVTGNHYVGDALTPHTITAGPNGAFVRIVGPDIGGPGINTIQTNLWTLSGKMAFAQTQIATQAPNEVAPGATINVAARVNTVPAGAANVAGVPVTFNYVMFKLQSGVNTTGTATVTTGANGAATLTLTAPAERSVVLVDSVFNGAGSLLPSSNMDIISVLPMLQAGITGTITGNTITFHLADEHGAAMAGQTLSFLTTAGTLSAATGVTSALGDVTVTIGGAPAAVVSASFGGFIDAAGTAYQPTMSRISFGTGTATRVATSAPTMVSPGDAVTVTASALSLPGALPMNSLGMPMTFNYVIFNLATGVVTPGTTAATTDATGKATLTLTAPAQKAIILVDSILGASGTDLPSSAMNIISVMPGLQPVITATSTAHSVTFHLADQHGAAMAGQTLTMLTTSGLLSTASGTTNATGDLTLSIAGGALPVVSASFGGLIDATGTANQPTMARFTLIP